MTWLPIQTTGPTLPRRFRTIVLRLTDEMYDDEVSIWAPLRTIGETMHRRICPLYTFDNRGFIHIAGSGVPFRAGEFRFLLTAAHVCFDSSKTPIPLFTMGSECPCGFQFVTSTRILKPTQDRAYYHLVYATRNPRGIIEFRGVEKRTVAEQEKVRWAAKREARIERTHQSELPFLTAPSSEIELDQERTRQLQRAKTRILTLLQAKPIRYGQLQPQVLEIPLVWESDLQQILHEMRDSEKLEIAGMGRRERKIKPSCQLRLLDLGRNRNT